MHRAPARPWAAAAHVPPALRPSSRRCRSSASASSSRCSTSSSSRCSSSTSSSSRLHALPSHQAVGEASAADDAAARLSRLRDLAQQLEAAVAREDYAQAKQLKDEADALRQQLPPVQQFAQAQLERLRSGSTQAKAQAIRALGEVGDEACLPDLAACLAQPELQEVATAAMWAVFNRPPASSNSEQVQALMAQGVALMESAPAAIVLAQPVPAFSAALEVFDAACKLEPSFAEAHNKRATVLFLMQDFQASIDVCELVLDLNPYHFAAAAGMGMCCERLLQLAGTDEERRAALAAKAIAAFTRALEIHPGLQRIQGRIDTLRLQLGDG